MSSQDFTWLDGILAMQRGGIVMEDSRKDEVRVTVPGRLEDAPDWLAQLLMQIFHDLCSDRLVGVNFTLKNSETVVIFRYKVGSSGMPLDYNTLKQEVCAVVIATINGEDLSDKLRCRPRSPTTTQRARQMRGGPPAYPTGIELRMRSGRFPKHLTGPTPTASRVTRAKICPEDGVHVYEALPPPSAHPESWRWADIGQLACRYFTISVLGFGMAGITFAHWIGLGQVLLFAVILTCGGIGLFLYRHSR